MSLFASLCAVSEGSTASFGSKVSVFGDFVSETAISLDNIAESVSGILKLDGCMLVVSLEFEQDSKRTVIIIKYFIFSMKFHLCQQQITISAGCSRSSLYIYPIIA